LFIKKKNKSDLRTQILASIPKPSVGISTAEFVKKEKIRQVRRGTCRNGEVRSVEGNMD
jgi:hypothetical protein